MLEDLARQNRETKKGKEIEQEDKLQERPLPILAVALQEHQQRKDDWKLMTERAARNKWPMKGSPRSTDKAAEHHAELRWPSPLGRWKRQSRAKS